MPPSELASLGSATQIVKLAGKVLQLRRETHGIGLPGIKDSCQWQVQDRFRPGTSAHDHGMLQHGFVQPGQSGLEMLIARLQLPPFQLYRFE
jgi:hypothetical protein